MTAERVGDTGEPSAPACARDSLALKKTLKHTFFFPPLSPYKYLVILTDSTCGAEVAAQPPLGCVVNTINNSEKL